MGGHCAPKRAAADEVMKVFVPDVSRGRWISCHPASHSPPPPASSWLAAGGACSRPTKGRPAPTPERPGCREHRHMHSMYVDAVQTESADGSCEYIRIASQPPAVHPVRYRTAARDAEMAALHFFSLVGARERAVCAGSGIGAPPIASLDFGGGAGWPRA